HRQRPARGRAGAAGPVARLTARRVERHSQQVGRMKSRPLLLLLLTLLAACDRRPSGSEALSAIRASSGALDTAPVEGRGWQDGPPWFSCAEVISKLGGRADRAAVHDQVGNWKSLVVAGW